MQDTLPRKLNAGLCYIIQPLRITKELHRIIRLHTMHWYREDDRQ